MSNTPANGKRSLGLFYSATTFTLPFILGAGVLVDGSASHNVDLLNIVVMFCLLGWPVLLVFGLIAFVYIVLSWIKSPRFCRPFLILYLLLMAGLLFFSDRIAHGTP
jgi:hypothetical protein